MYNVSMTCWYMTNTIYCDCNCITHLADAYLNINLPLGTRLTACHQCRAKQPCKLIKSEQDVQCWLFILNLSTKAKAKPASFKSFAWLGYASCNYKLSAFSNCLQICLKSKPELICIMWYKPRMSLLPLC